MKTKFIVAVVCEIQKGEDAALTTLVQLRLAHPSAYFIKPFIYGRNCSLCDFAAFCLSSQTLSELWMAKIKTYLYVSINFVYRIFFFWNLGAVYFPPWIEEERDLVEGMELGNSYRKQKLW